MTDSRNPLPASMTAADGFFIGGEIVPPSSDGRTALRSPSTEEIYASVPTVADEDIDTAVRSARDAFDLGEWPGLTALQRVEVVERALEDFLGQTEDLAQTAAYEIGAPVETTRGALRTAAAVVRSQCQLALSAATEITDTGGWDYIVQREPLGLVAIITPWNGPLAASVIKTSMALLAGCTVVSKPPPQAPFTAIPWAQALTRAGLPRGALNVVPADVGESERLICDPRVERVSFTGGTTSGRRVAELCGRQLKRVVLELGGKSAALVLDDADLDRVGAAVAAGSFHNSGQVCSALTRVNVPRHLVDQVLDRLQQHARAVVLGDPFQNATTMGPLASASHYQRVQNWLAVGVQEGAKIAIGGGRPTGFPRGYYVEPTVFHQVENSMQIAQEEIFGPVVVVIAHDGDEHAIELANDSKYGLGGAVFSRDRARALWAVSRLQTGSVSLNAFTTNRMAPRDPRKESGMGTTTGPEGYLGFLATRVVNLGPGLN